MANERETSMHTPWQIGDRLIHADHGVADVRFVGNDYIGLRFDDEQEALIRLDTASLELWSAAAEAAWHVHKAQADTRLDAPLPWPDSTFIFEADTSEDPHFQGSHWDAWFESGVAELVPRLPELLAEAVVANTPAGRDALHGTPDNWTPGFHLVWPDARRGILINIAVDQAEKKNLFVGVVPFDTHGSRHTLEIDRVRVWQSGVEAQIEAHAGEAKIIFYDTHFLLTRGEYERGRTLAFSLVGMAYAAHPCEIFELPFTPNPEVVAWHKQLDAERGETGEAEPERILLDGMAMFFPVEGWDIDDYQFRGPIKAVEPFDNFLDQSGWRVRVTVMRISGYAEEDFDLDLLITCRAWQGKAPPQLGQDIEGTLWLQGRLLAPDKIEA
jgi:hypothetical protein